MKPLRAIGLMSGTSMDGVDVALVETDGDRIVRQGPTSSLPYTNGERDLLRLALADAKTLSERTARPGWLKPAEEMVTSRHALAVERFLEHHQISPDEIDVVGFHGQTVLHRPEARLTVQIGDGAALARRLDIPVTCDFRAADVAAGGQGAPLVPVYHRALVEAAGFSATVAVLNVGGVANVTWVKPGVEPVACDTGPGNALIDDLMLARTGQPIDRDGATAAAGKVDAVALAALLDHPFFSAPPPKSLDRNAFSLDPVANLTTPDAAATLAAFTAESVARALALLPSRPTILVVCGGGARNPVIMRELATRSGASVGPAEARGWSSEFMEAQAFAYLAVRARRSLPITFPGTTGVSRPLTGGIIHQP